MAADDAGAARLGLRNHAASVNALSGDVSREQLINTINRLILLVSTPVSSGSFSSAVAIACADPSLSLTDTPNNKSWQFSVTDGGSTLGFRSPNGANLVKLNNNSDEATFINFRTQSKYGGVQSAIVKASGGQSANLLEYQDQGGGYLSGVDAQGRPVLPLVSGTPTGTAATGTMVYDTSANRLWIYSGGWRSTAIS